MARKLLIAGNWKMNKTAAEAREFIDELKGQAAEMSHVDILVCPTFTSLSAAAAAAAGTAIAVGAQNVHWEASGAYTAEISAEMLLEVPVEYAIIGHSERRQYFAETDETVNARLKAALGAGLKPIVCVGETLAQREADETEAVVSAQIRDGLAGLTADDMASTTVAYEPVWAIGTGVTASPAQAQDVHALIRGLLRDMFGDVAEQVRVLYGGSVKAANATELMAQEDIDGGLVGGASLTVDAFIGIMQNCK